MIPVKTNCMNLLDGTEHLDLKLTDVSSKSQMEMNGWAFDTNFNQQTHYSNGDPVDGRCVESNTWYGFLEPGDGKITATFTGSGTAELDYGNCGKYGDGLDKVEVYFNGKYINKAEVLELKKENGKEEWKPTTTSSMKAKFEFSPKGVLSITENGAIIKINSLKLTHGK